ncbi:DNA primase large subunit PriL [Candidatus Bathyarchaeota archaeon]|jgi:DNA primase large subunit|nr:DNA primase large subunit PriL [Candidatus Bathyarchaeota archaeon]
MKEAAEHVREVGLDINELESDFFVPFLDRAEERVRNALLDVSAYAKTQPQDEPRQNEIEIFSFPIAVMLVAATDDSLIKSRYSLAEAKRASTLLRDEEKEKLLEVADNFSWDARLVNDFSLRPYVFALRFPIFLKNATGFHDTNWKLVNHLMINGDVYLTEREVSRLLEEEVRKYIEGKLDTKIKSLPPTIMARVNQLRQLAAEKREQIRLEEMPERVVMEAFPSCIKGIYDRVAAGRPASHIGRFALTSFLLSIGMTVEDVFKFFRSVSDFNERMTRYQVEHIAGTRGSGTKYTPPNCATLHTHGICISPEPECNRAVNPLVCYKRKLQNVPEEKPTDDN